MDKVRPSMLLLLCACAGPKDVDDTACAAPLAWYEDADGDGYGAAPLDSACEQPAGAAAVAGDCADEDAAVNPDAEEICADGIDNDCDGGAPGCSTLVGTLRSDDADTLLEGSTNTMGYWFSGADYDGDGKDELVTSDGYAGDGREGQIYVVGVGAETASVVVETESLAVIRGLIADGEVGNSATALDDVTGDGVPDLAFLDRVESAYLYAGPVRGELSTADADTVLIGVDQTDERATQLASGDLDGDGQPDLLLSAQRDFGGTDPGDVWVVQGPVEGASLDLTTAARGHLAGEDADDRLGWMVVAGDAGGDGVLDLWTSAARSSVLLDRAGAAYLFDGPSFEGERALADADVTLGGAWAVASFGHQLAADGDLNGDGYQDLLVSASGRHADGVGGLYLFHGPLTALGGLTDAAALITSASTVSSGYVCHADFAGDPNGDGFTDVISSDCDAADLADRGGAAYLHYGPLSGAVGLTDAALTVQGSVTNHALGKDVGGVGDLDGDGLDDLGVGSFFGPDAWVFRGGVAL